MNNSSTRLYNVLMGNPSNTVNNAIGRTAGATAKTGDNFFAKRGRSLENAIGTTLAAPASFVYDQLENVGTEQMLNRQEASLDDIYKKYGYADANAYYDAKNAVENDVFGRYGYNSNDFWDKRAAADLAGNKDEVARLEQERQNVIARMSADDAARINQFDTIQNELKGQAGANAQEATDRAKAYEDYRKNNYVSQKINQDRGKFAGSAINTLSTGFDIASMAAGIPNGALINAGQGAIEGIADELEQNGLENFDWGRAGQNAAIGAAAGAATGALNTRIGNRMAARGGNLVNGNNLLARGINTAARSGVGRGALSGAVGGAVGGGLGAGFAGQNVVQGALQGAGQGAVRGAVAGGVMSGVNRAVGALRNRTPANAIQQPTTEGGVEPQTARNITPEPETTRTDLAYGESNLANRTRRGMVADGLERFGNTLEDANNRGVGMSIKDVSEETSNDTIRTNKTSAEGKLRNAAGLKLQKQYGTIDKPTAKATNAPETLQKIAKAGFTKPADVERMSDAITGSNGEVSKLVSNLVETAKPVNTFDGETSGQTLDDYIDLAIQKRGLDGINEGKAVKSQINALMRSLPSHAEGSIDFTDAPQDVFKMTQLLDAEAANYEGRSGLNYGTTNPDKLRAAQVIKDVSTLLKDRVYETVDVDKALTPEVAQNLKAYAPNNKDWANYVDNEIMSAKNIKDLRSAQAPWVRAKKIIDNGYINSVTYGGRNGGNNFIPSSRRGLAGAVLNATVNSKPALRAQAKALNTAADIANKVSTNANTDSSVPAPTPALAPSAAPTNTGVMEAEYNPSTQIYNAIGRTEGLTNGERATTANYLSNAVQEANNMPLAPNAGATTLESIVRPTANTGATNVYDSVYGTQTQPATATATRASYFPTTGDYWTDILAQAMTSAIDANDAAAFGALYGMYQDSLSNLQKQQTTSQDKLSDTQRRAYAAEQSLNELSRLTPDLGYNLSRIPVVGNIATFGGNTYDSAANSLATQIGYMLSGANIKEEEAERIGRSYVPQPFDTEATRNDKLRRARVIIEQYKNTYTS